jgi:hypothetical protein
MTEVCYFWCTILVIVSFAVCHIGLSKMKCRCDIKYIQLNLIKLEYQYEDKDFTVQLANICNFK